MNLVYFHFLFKQDKPSFATIACYSKLRPLRQEREKAEACGIFWMFTGLSLVLKVIRVETEYSFVTLDLWIERESVMKKGGTLDLEKTLAAPLIVLSRESFVLLCCCSSSALARCLSARHKQTYLQTNTYRCLMKHGCLGDAMSAKTYLQGSQWATWGRWE